MIRCARAAAESLSTGKVRCLRGMKYAQPSNCKAAALLASPSNASYVYICQSFEYCMQTMAKWGHRASEKHTVFTQTFFLILPRIWHSLFTPSMHIASKRPLPSIRRTCAYSAASRPSHYASHACRTHLTRSSIPLAESYRVSIKMSALYACPRTSCLRCPSSLKISSRFSSPSFFPRRHRKTIQSHNLGQDEQKQDFGHLTRIIE